MLRTTRFMMIFWWVSRATFTRLLADLTPAAESFPVFVDFVVALISKQLSVSLGALFGECE